MSNEIKNQNKLLLDYIKQFKDMLTQRDDFNEEEKKLIWGKYVTQIIEKNIIMEGILSIPPNSMVKSYNMAESNFAALVAKAKISQHNDIILFAIYYLIFKKNYENVTVTDIHQEYKEAYIKQSTNTNVFIKSLIKKGYIMSHGKKEGINAFTVTKEGINYVEEVLKNAR